MKVLIVHAYLESQSFTASLAVRAHHREHAGHNLLVTDLHVRGWNTALGQDDFREDLGQPSYFDSFSEQHQAHESKSFTVFHAGNHEGMVR